MAARFPELPVVDELLVDDPLWAYPSSVAAGEGVAHLRVWSTRHPTGHLAIVTDTGIRASTTNSAEHIAASLATRYPGHLVVLEHWSADGDGATDSPLGQEHLDQVTVDATTGRPDWRRIWPTPAANPNHSAFEHWMRTHGRTALASSLPTV